jgi:5-methylcytosine-specific restriction enzyme A
MPSVRTAAQRTDWHHFYTGAYWLRRRRAQLLEHPLCKFCAQRGDITRASVVDHVERHNGDWNKFVLGELQSLCKPCHDCTKQRVEHGHISAVDADGWPLDRK